MLFCASSRTLIGSRTDGSVVPKYMSRNLQGWEERQVPGAGHGATDSSRSFALSCSVETVASRLPTLAYSLSPGLLATSLPRPSYFVIGTELALVEDQASTKCFDACEPKLPSALPELTMS